MRTPLAYLNYIRNQIYINAVTDNDKTNYVDMTYDITTDMQALKNYLGIDSTLQQNAFESYPDLTDYYLILDDSWFIKDHTTIEVIDIYFSDVSDTTRYDDSVLLFTRDELIYDYTKQDSSTILHFKFKINKYPDITDFQVYAFPLFIQPNMGWIANDLIVQYDINFVNINFFTEHSLLMTLKEYMQAQYATRLNTKLQLNFLGWNNIRLIDYREMLNSMILDNLAKSIGKEWMDIRPDMAKYYFHDCTTVLRLSKKTDSNKIIDLFISNILDFYTNHIDWTVDMTAGFTTDPDLYEVAHTKERFNYEGDYFYDMLNVNFLRFVLIRNNIYSWKFTLVHDGTEFWSEFIKFKVKNIIPDQQYDFTFIQNGFDIDLTTVHTSDLPLKIDILEYSNNLVWASQTAYSRFINEYYFNGFELKFKGNKLTIDYGVNSLRLFVSDSLSEEYKDIRYTFVYAPWEVISEKIAKIRFTAQYHEVKNTWNVEKLLPLSDDYTGYEDLSARFFESDDSRDQMWVQIPISYELVYCKDVPIRITLDTTDSTGGLLNQFKYLIWDKTEMNMTIPPTLDLSNGEFGKSFVVMFRYKFDTNAIYTDEVIQKMNGIVHASISSDSTVDETDVNYFEEFIDVHFVTTRFRLRKKSHEPIQTVIYTERDAVGFKPPFSTQKMFSMYTQHEYKMDRSEVSNTGGCNFSPGIEKSDDIARSTRYNRTNTVKGLPISIKAASKQTFSVSESEMTDIAAAKTGTAIIAQQSSVVGWVKQMDNFARDHIWRTVLHRYSSWVVNDLFNWYMSYVQNDIQMTYQTDYDTCRLSVLYQAEWMDNLLKSDNSKNEWSMIKFAFDYYGQDHTSANPYSDADLKLFGTKVPSESAWGATSYAIYQLASYYAMSLDIKFERSEIYSLTKMSWFMREAFIKKYHPELLPSTWKFSKYGDLGELDSTGNYNWGDRFREGLFGGTPNIIDEDSSLVTWAREFGLGGGMNCISTWFADNVDIDFTTQQGQLLQLTAKEVIELYFTDEHDVTAVYNAIIGSMFAYLNACLQKRITVKRIYSADVTAILDNITDDMFSVYMEPTSISPLYSHFKITDIKFVYDKNTVVLTELFDKQYLTSTKFKVNEIIGTGLKFQCKYLNRSISEVPMAVMIYYVDEFGYEKTTSVELTLRSKLQSFTQSEASVLMRYGVNILKALQLLHVFDQNTQVVTDTEDALKAGVDSVMQNDDMGATASAKQFWGGLFEAKKRYNNIFKKYLSDDVLNAFYYEYLENRIYGRPHFQFNSHVSLFVLPENISLLEDNDPIRKWAEDAGRFFTDATYRSMEGWPFHGKDWGDDFNPCLDYYRAINFFYDKYRDRRGYDVNLILLPDTTYNVSLKTFLVFDWNLTAGEKAMPTLSGFLSSIGGGSEGLCMTHIKEFLTLARIYPNYEDLVHGILRDLYIPNNFERYGRVPSAMNPITVKEYYPNQQDVDYNTFINSGSFWYVEFEKSSKAHFGLVVPFEKIVLAIDTTSTGLFDVNFTHLTRSNFDTGFGYFDEMRGSNININKWNEKITVSVQVPSVIPRKYIDVIVRSLF